MKLNQKRRQNSRQNLGTFILGWTLIWLTALFLPYSVAIIFTGNNDFFGQAHWVVFYTVLSILQFFWVRRQLRFDLRHWILLTVLGAIVGTVAFHSFEALVQRPSPPKLWSESPSRMPELEHVMQLKYALYITVTIFFLQSTPLIFQWLALRKRFRNHGLWLLAAAISAPLDFIIVEEGAIFVPSLRALAHVTGFNLIRDAQPLGSIVAILDWTIPTVIMGLVLYWLLTQSQKIKTDQIRAHQR